MPAGRLRCAVSLLSAVTPPCADLQQELAVLGELEDLAVAVAVAGQPDVVAGIDGDAVLAAAGTAVAVPPPLRLAGLALRERRVEPSPVEPFVGAVLRRTAPSGDVAAGRAEFEDRRRRRVAVERRVVLFERVRAMEHPDIAVGIRGRPADAAEQRVCRHGRKIGVDFEYRENGGAARLLVLRGGVPLEDRGAQKAHDRDRPQPDARQALPRHHGYPPSNAHCCVLAYHGSRIPQFRCGSQVSCGRRRCGRLCYPWPSICIPTRGRSAFRPEADLRSGRRPMRKGCKTHRFYGEP